jgi:hypothetical protein
VAEWTAGHGTPPSATTIIKLRQQATLSTRTAKSESITPLHQLSAQWRNRAMAKGFEPEHVLAATVRRSHRAPFRASDFAPSWIDAVGSLARERVATKRSTWNRWNLLAEAERDEYDYLAQIAAAEALADFLETHSPDSVAELQQSPSWGVTVAAWRRSVQLSRPSTQRMVMAALESSGSAKDVAAVLHSRLRRFVSEMPSAEEDLLAPVPSARPDLSHLLRQVQERIQRRMDHVTRNALTHEAEWKRHLVEILGLAVQSEDVHDVVRRIAIYRDRWGVDDSPLPLGPIPADYEWERKEQHGYLDCLIGHLAHPPAGQPQGQVWVGEPGTQAERLINVGWQL